MKKDILHYTIFAACIVFLVGIGIISLYVVEWAQTVAGTTPPVRTTAPLHMPSAPSSANIGTPVDGGQPVLIRPQVGE